MKRPMLVSGITMFIVCAVLINFSKIGALVMLLTGALAFVLFSVTAIKKKRFIIMPVISIAAILICTSFLSYTHFKIEPILRHDNKTTYISGKVISSPVNIDGILSFVLETEKIGTAEEKVKIDVTTPAKDSQNPKLYDYISIDNAELYVKRNESNKFDLTCASDGILLNAKAENTNILFGCEKTPFYYCVYLKEATCNRIDKFLVSPSSGILKGLVFGGSTNVPSNITDSFRNSGITHLLAVSGLHTSLWCGLLIFIFKLFKAPKKVRNIFCIIFLMGFCTLTGFTPSVLRSSFMSFLAFCAPFAKEEPDSLNSLGFACTILLLCNPYIIFSLSFQLSLSATIGVLFVTKYELSIRRLINRLKIGPLRPLLTYLICSFLISAGAGFFTLPVSALSFNVLSIMSPVTNLLCVKPAFYAMICGTVATATSFIEIPLIQKLTHFLFDISHILLTLVSDISFEISQLTYCTIPIHTNWLLNGLVCGTVIMATGYLIFKFKSNKRALKISAVIMILLLLINIFIPLFATPCKNTLTVISSGDNLNVIIRSGTRYAYIINSENHYPSDVYSFLPKATCESLDYFIATYLNYESCIDLERLSAVITPEETYITPEIHKVALAENISLPPNTIVKKQGKYTLNNEINIEIIDTYPTKYVIIRGSEKTAYIHLYGSAELGEVTDTSQGSIFIYNSAIPEVIPPTARTTIISGSSDFLTHDNYNEFINHGENILLTAKDGNISINI